MMSNSEARKRAAANEARDDVETLVDGSSQTELRRVVELAIAASPEPPDGFLGEDITLAILASDWLAAHTAAAEARGAQAVVKAVVSEASSWMTQWYPASESGSLVHAATHRVLAAAREAARNAGAS